MIDGKIEASSKPVPAGLGTIYKTPQPLRRDEHGDWRVANGDLSFAQRIAMAPVCADEVAAVAKFYPIVFVEGCDLPVAVLGASGENVFVSNGRWLEQHYVPAYFRRYPFISYRDKAGKLVLGIDAGADAVRRGGADGAALFENSELSALGREAAAFCAAFDKGAEKSRRWVAELRKHQLLTERTIRPKSPAEPSVSIGGFQLIDERKRTTVDALMSSEEWRLAGWGQLARAQVASVRNFAPLLQRLTPQAMPRKSIDHYQ